MRVFADENNISIQAGSGDVCRRMWQLISQPVQAVNGNITALTGTGSSARQLLLLCVTSDSICLKSLRLFKSDEA